ncbi:Cro/C1-type helix-turn-helix DNA-binding protein [Bacteroides heparinolyticus]|uniref:Cro/C1-type helix-turn-helix DNA-binding protein n=1 Tax=Prevotella heparinolytica TaxID=28113 RepID=A0A4R2LPN7_9BACE|nr:Cro/C1-type helix-turn-helix DNA-binding protein [Bacteroides heparinolyticus]
MVSHVLYEQDKGSIERRMSQTELSIRLGKNFNMVNLYVINKHQPSLPTLYQIADILNMDVRDLLVPNKKQNI